MVCEVSYNKMLDKHHDSIVWGDFKAKPRRNDDLCDYRLKGLSVDRDQTLPESGIGI